MKYYPTVTIGLRAIAAEKFPEAKPVFKDVDTIYDDFEEVCYLLWMLEELQKYEGPEMMGRRGRWIGYVHKGFEDLGIVTNAENRKMTRLDVANRME